MISIDPNRTVFELTRDHPGLISALAQAGFPDVANAAVRNTAGRIMTLEKGIEFKGLDKTKVTDLLLTQGYSLE